jgi:hypothetical protein
VHVWGELSQETQEKLFEHALVAGHQSEGDESLREGLAKYLHEHHERTMSKLTRLPRRRGRVVLEAPRCQAPWQS